jgi:hypothetical protein
MKRLLATVRRIPRAGRACALIALVNAVVWSVVVPPFQVPDEISHFGYAQYLAETGKLPPQTPNASQYSDEEQTALNFLHFFTVVGRRDQRGLWTTPEDKQLRAALAAHPSPKGAGGVSSATNQPPLYYALTAAAYWISPGHDILTRLYVMRLVSAVLAAGTVLAIFLFIRELLPGTPWAWTVGALGVAFQPQFMFIAAGVHGDNLLFFASACLLFTVARAFKRGLTTRRATAIGLATVIGVLGKLTFLAFIPAIVLAFLLLLWRAAPRDRREAFKGTAVATAVVAVPVALYGLLNVAVWHRSGGATGGGVVATTASTASISIRERVSYIWQLALPRLPFMQDEFPAYFPPWETWFRGTIGRFGWLDYDFPKQVYTWALAAFAACGLSALVEFVRSGLRIGATRLGWRLSFAAVIAVMVIGLFVAIGWQGIAYRHDTGNSFEQARYLFPLLGLYGLFLALAARGAGKKWGPAVGALIVVLAMAHGLYAELLTVSRYYG